MVKRKKLFIIKVSFSENMCKAIILSFSEIWEVILVRGKEICDTVQNRNSPLEVLFLLQRKEIIFQEFW